MQFDARAAKALKPGAHLTIDGCPGLRLEATETRRSWTYRYRSPIDGHMRQVLIGHWPAMPLPAAVGDWERLRVRREAGGDPSLEKRQARAVGRQQAQVAREAAVVEAYTVARLADDYLVGHVERARKPKGAAEVRRTFATMLGEFAGKPAAHVTRGECFDLLDAWAGTPVQAAKLRAELGAAWDYALDAGRLPDSSPNWWRQIMRGRLKSKGKVVGGRSVGTAKRVLTVAELRDLIPWLPNFPRLIDDALTMYLWTLARGVEIMAIEAAEVAEEADGWWWTVPKVKTKNARHEGATDFRVPLEGRALAVVKRRLAVVGGAGGYLFPSTGVSGHVEQKTIQTGVHYAQPYSRTWPERVRPRLTVTHWAPHDLRRTARTLLTSMGCPDDVGEALLGHIQPGVKGVYNLHHYDEQRRHWVKLLSARLEVLA